MCIIHTTLFNQLESSAVKLVFSGRHIITITTIAYWLQI